jgi:hypothetical protein
MKMCRSPIERNPIMPALPQSEFTFDNGVDAATSGQDIALRLRVRLAPFHIFSLSILQTKTSQRRVAKTRHIGVKGGFHVDEFMLNS